MKTAKAPLQPVKDNTLRAQVAQQILEMVTGGHYAPGEKLTENALAEQLRVSRAPLREAFRELVDKGVLVSQPYRGLYVRPVGATDLKELYSMRTALERFAFELAWDKRSPEALTDLRGRYDALSAVQPLNRQAEAINCELLFHSWVYEVTQHGLLMSHWQRLVPLVQIYMSQHHKTHGSHGQFKHMTKEYFEIATSGSLAAMLEHINEHMKQGLAAVLESLESTSDGVA